MRLRVRLQGYTAAEARLRYLGMGSTNPVYDPHPILGRAFRPGARFVHRSYLGQEIPWRINASGYRGEEIATPKPSGRFRILCLGASTTFCGENPEGKTYPDILARLLREARPGLDVEPVNAGVPGYTAVETVIDFALRAQALEPDLVIVYHGVNDVNPALAPGFRPDYAHWRPFPRGEARGIDALLERSFLYLALRQRVRSRAPARSLPPLADAPPEAVEALGRHTASLSTLAKARGAKLVVATFAHAIDVYPEMAEEQVLFLGMPHPAADSFRRTIARFNDELRATAAREGSLLVDLAARMPRSRETYYDWPHWTDEGCAKAASILAEEILAAGLVPPAR